MQDGSRLRQARDWKGTAVSMDGWSLGSSLVMLASGLGLVATGVVTLKRQRVAFQRQRQPLRWRPWGWALLLLGVSVLLEAISILGGASGGSRLAFVIVVVPLVIAASTLGLSARQPVLR
jgi:hypothetical protein